MQVNHQFVYFDNATSSFPKPLPVVDAMRKYLINIAVAPHHSQHSLSDKALAAVEDATLTIADFFGAKSEYKHFFFTVNATYAINQVLLGFLKSGDHVIYSSLEHNAVFRPIKLLESKGIISSSIWQCSENGELRTEDLKSLIQPNTKLIMVTHASNIISKISDIKSITQIAHENHIKIGVDATQSAGVVDINLQDLNVDFLFFTGHKFLLGPVGIGGAYIKNHQDVDAVIVGGGGNHAGAIFQPNYLPDKFEPGTQNAVGIIGLAAGIKYLKAHRPLSQTTSPLMKKLLGNLAQIEEIKLYPTNIENDFVLQENFSSILSFKVSQSTPAAVTHTLSNKFNIATRAGLHCAPLAHKSLGSYPNGTIRISLGYHNNDEEVSYFLNSLKKIILNSSSL